ncbi:unnamed protein product, partial [Candidula unifasciata]
AYMYFLFFSAIVFARGSCVNLATKKAMACTSQLDIGGIFAGSSPNKPIGQGNIDRLVQACRNGDLLTAIGCLEMAVDECRDNRSDSTLVFKKMIDTKKARTSIDYFCYNIRVYNSSVECIELHHREQDVCAQDAKSSYYLQSSSAGDVDSLLLFHCQFYEALMTCVQNVLQVKCSQEAANLVRTVMEGFKPPVCSEKATTVSVVKTDDNGDSDTAGSCCYRPSTHNSLMILFIAMLLFLC